MEYNLITIDPSISCTAMIINDKRFVFTDKDLAVGKSGNYKKWFELVSPLVEIHTYNKDFKKDYSKSEIGKLQLYDDITNSILDVILLNIDNTKETIIGIEGYSYSSADGKLIDLVTFSTQLRYKLFKKISIHIDIYAPKSLKLDSAKFTYQPTDIGKKKPKLIWQNNEGVKGGSFKKPEMLKCLIENNKLQCEWVSFLRQNYESITGVATIPKPIEDINDAKLMYEIMKKDL